MSKEDLMEAMGHVDDRILERYVQAEKRLATKKIWVKRVAAAACFALIIGLFTFGIWGGLFPNVSILPTSGPIGPSIQIGVPSTPTMTLPNHTAVPTVPPSTIPDNPPFVIPTPPVYPDAAYTAWDIAAMFPGAWLDSTSYYQCIYTEKAEYLDVCPVPTAENLPVFQYQGIPSNKEEAEVRYFIDTVLCRLSRALEIEIPEYTLVSDSFLGDPTYYHTTIDTEDYSIYFTEASFGIVPYALDASTPIRLNGEIVQIDQRQNNQDILNSLEGIKQTLFDILDVSFADTHVVRKYINEIDPNVYAITVYYYNRDESELNTLLQTGFAPQSGFISITFDNYNNWNQCAINDHLLSNVQIHYQMEATERNYPVKTQQRRISLEEAEVLLYNGYVFGGHRCPLCMKAQVAVDFADYDYVGLEYLFTRSYNKPTEGIPFYAFYKQIGVTENGNLIFAKTYVPAIEVSGYTEYFESQKEEHPS